jgi:hypothetical protein
MKRPVAVRWLILSTGVLAVGLTAYFFIRGKWPGGDNSIVLSEPFHTVHGLTIENGSTFDQGSVDIRPYKKLIVPKDAEVRNAAAGAPLQVFMRKTLSFHGHPPEPMSVWTARKNMGCAVKAEGETLHLATFGEWDSRIEGGASMCLMLLVPEGVEVEKRSRMSGPDSVGREWNGQYLTKPKDAKGGYWYGPASPAEGWAAIPDVPDPKRVAESVSPRNDLAALAGVRKVDGKFNSTIVTAGDWQLHLWTDGCLGKPWGEITVEMDLSTRKDDLEPAKANAEFKFIDTESSELVRDLAKPLTFAKVPAARGQWHATAVCKPYGISLREGLYTIEVKVTLGDGTVFKADDMKWLSK